MTTQQAPYVRNVLKKHADELAAQEATLSVVNETVEEMHARQDAIMAALSADAEVIGQHKGLLQDLLRESAAHEGKLLDHERLLGGTSATTASQAAMLKLLLTLGFWAKVRWFFFGTLPESPIPNEPVRVRL